MAKTANNSKSRQGGSKAGKAAQGGKAAARRAEGKPGRGKAPVKAQQKGRVGKPGEKRGVRRFLHDVRIEMGKVAWPTRKDLLQSTLVVLVAVAIATAYSSVLDLVFSKAVDLVLTVIR